MRNVLPHLDYALLDPCTLDSNFEYRVDRAIQAGVRSICVLPSNTLLVPQETRVCTVVGFPHGCVPIEAKKAEVNFVANFGVYEFDVCCNVSALVNRDWDFIYDELVDLMDHIHAKVNKAITKLIIESALLDDQGIDKMCDLALDLGFNFVKTSSGHYGNATVHDVARMLQSHKHVKASGGIKTVEDAIRFLDLGCEIIGSSTLLGV